jgi:hypothetical protein
MNRCGTSNRAPRKGAAFLILVVLVLLVLVGATRTLVRSEVTSRRSEGDQARVRSMRAAINATLQTTHDSSDPIRFPLDDKSTEYIELTVNQDRSLITARWYKGDQAIDAMTQEIETKAETTE